MINIRSIKKNELERFVSIGNIKNRDRLRKVLLNFLDNGETSYGHFFVAERENKFIARVMFFSPLANSEDVCTFALSIPWEDEDYLEIGRELLSKSMLMLKKEGVLLVEQRVDAGFQHSEKMEKLMKAAEIPLVQEKFSMVYKKSKIPNNSGRLKFKTISETGEREFIEAIEKVTRETLDKVDRLSVEKYGSHQAALNYYNGLKHIDFNSACWLLAYDNENKGAGLVVSQEFSGESGAINYIGVFPEQRGRGYVSELIARGTAVLKEAGVSEVIADIDKENFPMENALLQAGYQKESEFSVYLRLL